MRIKQYYQLTKPGIIYGNLLTAVAGFLFGCKWHINFLLCLSTLLGISLVIASACVFNNYIDRSIDNKMKRTKKRALVLALISGRDALIYATALGLLGFLVLIFFTNTIVVSIGLIAFFFYIILYGISKRKSVHGTIVGSVPGAAPVVAGYCAASGHFNGAACLLFLVLVFWQMPHFYAIAMFRFDDYKAAGLPVLPVKKGMHSAKIHIVFYVAAFIVASSSLTLFYHAGYSYLVVLLLIGVYWLMRGVQGFRAGDDSLWARNMFFVSLLVIVGFSVMLALSPLLP